MIRAIIWDVGGVLWRLEDQSAHRAWEDQLGLQRRELAEIVFGNPVALHATIGAATPQDVWLEVQKRLSLSSDQLVQLKSDIWSGGMWDGSLLEYIKSLKKDFKMGIISDSWADARETISPWINYTLFDEIFFSAEEGVCKPNRIIFERMLARLNVEADETIFIDDWQASVEGAKALGIHAVLYSADRDVRDDIEKILGLHNRPVQQVEIDR